MAAERLYRVTAKEGTPPKHRIFKSSTLGKVESQLVSERYEIKVANSIEVSELMAAGVKVEEAK